MSRTIHKKENIPGWYVYWWRASADKHHGRTEHGLTECEMASCSVHTSAFNNQPADLALDCCQTRATRLNRTPVYVQVRHTVSASSRLPGAWPRRAAICAAPSLTGRSPVTRQPASASRGRQTRCPLSCLPRASPTGSGSGNGNGPAPRRRANATETGIWRRNTQPSRTKISSGAHKAISIFQQNNENNRR